MFRSVIVGCLLAGLICVDEANANSCSNIVSFGSYDESGLHETPLGLYAVGTFRIATETDESKQPMFNLSTVNCETQRDEQGRESGLECKVTKALVWADPAKPDADNPNCSLDLDTSTFSMKELQRGILAGADDSTNCFSTMLPIDKNTKRVYMSFTRTKYADRYDKIKPGTCGRERPQHVLMNCTAWAGNRKGAKGRYCDFSGAGDKK